jgi:predicted HAD superfamily phosphohydrolase
MGYRTHYYHCTEYNSSCRWCRLEKEEKDELQSKQEFIDNLSDKELVETVDDIVRRVQDLEKNIRLEVTSLEEIELAIQEIYKKQSDIRNEGKASFAELCTEMGYRGIKEKA